jgi:transposase
MSYREVTMMEIREVLRLWLGGVPKARIAEQLGLDRKTVRRYIAAAVGGGLVSEEALTDEYVAELATSLRTEAERPRGDTWARCIEQRGFIDEHLRSGVKLSKVRRLLLRQGVDVPYTTLYRFAVAELGFGRTAATIPVADCGPGEEVQLDTGWVLWLEPDLFAGKRRRVRAWIFTSVLSRHRFVWPCLRETTESAIEACEAAWEFFGGVFRTLIPDNTKAIVQTADPLQPRINVTFLEYAQKRGFVVDTTRARSPKDKARVERAVQTVRDDCFGGEHIYDVEQGRAHARHWCLREYGMRRHTRTQRMPLEHFDAVEKPALLPAPAEPYDVPIWCDPKVARDQHAQVAKALYSLPTRFVGKTLRARADRALVRFYDGHALVKTHPRQPPGGRSTDRHDFPVEKTAYALRDVAFLERQAYEHGDAVGRFAHALLDSPLPWTRMRRVYALLALARRYGDARLNETCAIALDADMLDIERLKRMLERGAAPSAPPPSRVIPLSRYLRPAQQYALPFPTKTGEDPT